jgi:hypothetical protein
LENVKGVFHRLEVVGGLTSIRPSDDDLIQPDRSYEALPQKPPCLDPQPKNTDAARVEMSVLLPVSRSGIRPKLEVVPLRFNTMPIPIVVIPLLFPRGLLIA